jgi:hypothetical protein
MGKNKEKKKQKKTSKKIEKHMDKHKIGQSDGLEVNDNGDVVYNPKRDERSNPTRPPGTPSV